MVTISFVLSICIHRSVILIFIKKKKSTLVDFFPRKIFFPRFSIFSSARILVSVTNSRLWRRMDLEGGYLEMITPGGNGMWKARKDWQTDFFFFFSVFSVSIRTVCHLIFLTFFLWDAALSWHLSADSSSLLLRPLEKRSFFVFGPTVWNSQPSSLRKQCFTTFITKLKTHLLHIHLCWSASVSFCMYYSGGRCVCVCVWLCVCMCVCVRVCVWSLVCMVGIISVYVDTVFGFNGHFF